MSDQDNQESEEAARWYTGPLYGLRPLREPLALPPGNHDAGACRAAILDRHRALDAERITLSALWNATLPINCLPNETFTEIFLEFTGPPDSGRAALRSMPRGSPFVRPFGWLPLTLVCRHWWAIARTTPTLWRTIDIHRQRGPQDLLHLALQRSVNAVLDITFYRARTAVAAVPALTPHVARIRKLVFPEADEALLPSLYSLLDHNMPHLNHLTLYGDLVPPSLLAPLSSRRDTVVVPPGNLPVVFPPSRFPSLMYLSLTYAVLPMQFQVSLPPTLHKLTMTGCTFELATSLSAFLQVLGECHALEDLRLDGLPMNLSFDRTPPSFVKLPRLKHLMVSDDHASRIARFVETLHVPPDITLSLSGLQDLPADPPRLSSLLPRDFKSRFPVFSSIQSVDFYMTGIYVEMSFGRGCSLKLESGHQMEQRWSCLSELPALLDKSRLTNLSMRGALFFALQEDHWCSLFEALPCIEHFELSCDGYDVQPLLVALSPTLSLSPATPSRLVGISLRYITIYGGDWEDSIMDTLKSFLTSRTRAGAPLQALRLQFRFDTEAEFTEQKAIFLAQVVPSHPGGALEFDAAQGYRRIEDESDLSGLSDDDAG